MEEARESVCNVSLVSWISFTNSPCLMISLVECDCGEQYDWFR